MAQQPGNNDNSLDSFMIMGCILVAMVFFWLFAHEQIVRFCFGLWNAEAAIFGIFSDKLTPFREWMDAHSANSVTWTQFTLVGNEFSRFSRWVSVIILPAMAIAVYLKAPKERHKRKFSMDSLAKSEHLIWPQVTPTVGLNLVQQDQLKGPWASSVHPREFVHNLKLLDETGELIQSRAADAFARQLGPMFNGVMKMPVHYRALFAMFAARVQGKDKEANQMVRHFALTTQKNGKPDFSQVDEWCRQYGKHKKILKVASMHAYCNTFMTSMLQIARGKGICNDTDFLCWLKPMDRTLWYAMNQTGRRVAWTEAAGVRAHWLVEIISESRMETPMVNAAVVALIEELEVSIDPDEDEIVFKY